MDLVPLEKNTVALTTLALIAALGIVVRLSVRIPIIPGLLELTPGFLFSELGGVIGGIPGGIIVGAIVGVGGALGGGEVPILPMVGNICLGIGTGWAIHLSNDRDNIRYALMAITGAGIFGGFIPSMTVFVGFAGSLEAALIAAIIDGIQATFWAIVALFLERYIIRPTIGDYLYRNPQTGVQQITN